MVYIGGPGWPRREVSEHEIGEAIESNVAAAANLTSEQVAAEIAEAMRTVDGPTPLRGTRYTFGYGVEVRHGARLLDTVKVLGLRDALTKIGRDQQEGCGSIEFRVLTTGRPPGDLLFGKGQWDDYGFVIVEDIEWGPLLSSTHGRVPVHSKHLITPRRIAELLTLTTNAQVGLDHGLVTINPTEQLLLRGVVDTKTQYGVRMPTDASFWLTRSSEDQIYAWHVRVNRWEQELDHADSKFGVLVSEATKGHLAWKRHDDEKEIMALARCLERMWAPDSRHNKRDKIRNACRRWMIERNQDEREISAVLELLDRFYERSRNPLAHEATGQVLSTDVERAHLNARIRGVIEDYIWWNLTGEWTRSRPKIISRGEGGGTHRMLWTQMWCHWKEQGLSVEEIARLWT